MGSHSRYVGAVFFDVDGTLVPGTTSSTYLAEYIGHRDVVANAERAYADGTMTNQQVSVIDAAGWAGTSEAQVVEWLVDLPLVAGIEATVAWCWENGLAPMLATLAWEPVGRFLTDRFGFHSFCGPQLKAVAGLYTGGADLDFDEYNKRDFAVNQALQLGVSLKQCAAVGDSRSDLPLFAQVGLSIAFNATPAAIEAATEKVSGDDLRLVIPALSKLLS